MQRFYLHCCQRQNTGMKLMLILISVASLTLLSCSKPSQSRSLSKNSITEKIPGKWRYTQSYYSIGGPLIYVSTESLGQWIVFNDDGGFASNMPNFESVTTYEIVDSLRVKFITPGVQSGFRLFYLSLDAADNSLSLSPADPVCIEGCGDKFKRAFF